MELNFYLQNVVQHKILSKDKSVLIFLTAADRTTFEMLKKQWVKIVEMSVKYGKVFVSYKEFLETMEYLNAWAKVKLRADKFGIDTTRLDSSYNLILEQEKHLQQILWNVQQDAKQSKESSMMIFQVTSKSIDPQTLSGGVNVPTRTLGDIQNGFQSFNNLIEVS